MFHIKICELGTTVEPHLSGTHRFLACVLNSPYDANSSWRNVEIKDLQLLIHKACYWYLF